ncbi:hypothetical protein ND748_01800 [Frankia sp. AiPs1]|uniref:hypothetical protein n=1 Tax=Frankia sp. AiPs1 TaxID=573493 RepID=UPI00204426A5|nr:hypothetical protein [Frankia sp. AiPs1]MCM3920421.1 hypothetical protein [Frankia sp. AiPs1]
MTVLGDALEAMVTSTGRWTSLRAELHWRVDGEARSAAQKATQAALGLPPVIFPPGAPWPSAAAGAVEQRSGSLLAAPDLLRIDWHDGDAVTVVRGDQWRRRRDGQVQGSYPGEPGNRAVALWISELVLVRPWQVLAALSMSVRGVQDRQGRRATWLRGVLREPGALRQIHGLPAGDAYDLVVDDATGLLVELTAWSGEREVERATLGHPQVDGPLEAGRFELDTVGPVEDSEPASPGRRPRRLAALAGEVDFTLLSPRDEAYFGSVDADEDGIAVMAYPSGGRPLDRRLWFVQSRGARMADPAQWETIVLADGTPARWWSPAADPEQGHLRFERAGTQVWIQGRDHQGIHDLAAGLAPVRP